MGLGLGVGTGVGVGLVLGLVLEKEGVDEVELFVTHPLCTGDELLLDYGSSYHTSSYTR